MIDFNKATFVKSCPTLSDKPELNLGEILFVGKSNVGKSSLLNALTSRKSLAFVSSKPGHTRLLNYYLIDNSFYLVDAPGYGFTLSGSRFDKSFGTMMEDYFENKYLRGVVFLIDSRHEPSKDDVDFYNFLIESDVNFVIALSKCDKLNQKETAAALKNMKAKLTNLDVSKIVYTSAKEPKTMEELKRRVVAML